MILGRLFQALFERGVVVVATSNTAPDDLFKGQPGRDAFLPFIALIKQRLRPADDGRRRGISAARGCAACAPGTCRPTRRAERALDAAFAELTGGAAPQPEMLTVMGRKLVVPLAAEGVARFDFAALCGTALGAGDYLALATHYHTLILDGIPRLSPDELRRGAALHHPDRRAVRPSREAARFRRRGCRTSCISAARTRKRSSAPPRAWTRCRVRIGSRCRTCPDRRPTDALYAPTEILPPIALLPAEFAGHLVDALDRQREHAAFHQFANHADRGGVRPALLGSGVEPGGAAVMAGQALQPAPAGFLVPVFHAAAGLDDLVGAHGGVADEDQLVVRAVGAHALRRWRSRLRGGGGCSSTLARRGSCGSRNTPGA